MKRNIYAVVVAVYGLILLTMPADGAVRGWMVVSGIFCLFSAGILAISVVIERRLK